MAADTDKMKYHRNVTEHQAISNVVIYLGLSQDIAMQENH